MDFSKKGVRAKQKALHSKSIKWGRKIALTIAEVLIILVIGIGLCGICPMPMFILMNVSDIPGFFIPILNIVVDMLKDLSAMTMKLADKSAKTMIVQLIKKEDDNINKLNEEISEIQLNIENLRNGVGEDAETLRSLRKKNGEDTTSKGKKNKKKNRKERK